MSIVWHNGSWLEEADFKPAAGDRAITLGLGLFETMLATEGRLAFPERHGARLTEACRRLGWPEPCAAPPALSRLAAELLERNHLTSGQARVRLTVSGGSGPLNDLSVGADHSVWLTAAPLGPAPAELAVTLSPWPRNERSPLAGLKCVSYAENVVALDHARRAGCSETLFFNTAGLLCEAATANVFLVGNGALATPDLTSGCLPGITRGVIIDLAARLGIACREAALTAEDLAAAEGVFLTSALRGPVPITRVDTRSLPVAPMLPILRAAWQALL